MGPESNSGHMVAYLDGKPIEIKGPLPEFTIEDISEDARTAKKALEAWEDICITMEVVGDGLRDFFDKTELCRIRRDSLIIGSTQPPCWLAARRNTAEWRNWALSPLN